MVLNLHSTPRNPQEPKEKQQANSPRKLVLPTVAPVQRTSGITPRHIGENTVDVSGRPMVIRRFAGRKARASEHELIKVFAQRGLQECEPGKSIRDVHIDAGIKAWKLCRSGSPGGSKSFDKAGNYSHGGASRSIRKEVKNDIDEDDHYVLTQPPPATSGDRSFMQGMLNPEARSQDFGDFEASEELIAALKTPPKDRQYEELEHVIQFLDSLTNEPFASMNEFEKLKAAMICETVTASYGNAIIKRGESPPKLFVLVKGRVEVFDFRKALKDFERARQLKLGELRRAAFEQDGEQSAAVDMEKFREEWSEKRHKLFNQTYRLIDQLDSGTLPEGTVHAQRMPGFVCGHEIVVPEEHFTEELSTRTIVSTCEKGSHSFFLTLNKANCDSLADIIYKDWGGKAQLLRNIRLTAGMSRLGIKLLAMQAQLQEVPSNSVIIPQGSPSEIIYVIKRGFVRLVKKIMPVVKKKENRFPDNSQMKTTPNQRSKKQALEEQEKAKIKERERNVITSLQGCYVEMGMLGITHTFGAVSVLEIRQEHPMCNMPAYVISCRNVTLLTLSRNDVLKISFEDREIMRQNARRDEDFDKPDSQIAAEFASGEKWTEYKNNVLEGIVKDKKAWRNDVLGSCFINGPASGVVVRPHAPSDQPDLDTYNVKTHPFSVLGTVAIGLY